jgi:hypothetical protein
VTTHERQLPDSLTRLLAEPPPRAAGRSQADRISRRAERGSAHSALETVLLRGFVYGVSGLVWLVVAGLVAHHFTH